MRTAKCNLLFTLLTEWPVLTISGGLLGRIDESLEAKKDVSVYVVLMAM